MQRLVNMARAWLFGLVWGLILSAAWTLSDVFWHNPYRYDTTRGNSLLSFPLLSLVLAAVGTLLAVPYAVAVGVYENVRENAPPTFLWRSVLIGIVWSLVPLLLFFLLFFSTASDSDYGATGFLTAPQRMGLTGYVAALVASYIVGRELPQAPVNNAVIFYDRFARVIWLSLIVAFLLILHDLFFPVFSEAG